MPLIYLDQIADKKLKASSTEDAVTNIYASSTASVRTAGGLSVEKRIMVGQFYGRVPLGATIPVVGFFASANNTGAFTVAPGIPATGVVSDDGYMICDGALITDVLSPFESLYVPKLDDDRFLQGSVSAGTVSVSNGVNLANNTVTLGVTHMPSHDHGGGGGGSTSSAGGATYNIIGSGGTVFLLSSGGGPNTPGIAIGAGTPGNQINGTLTTSNHSHSASYSISAQGGNAPFDIRPKWLSAIYLIRVI